MDDIIVLIGNCDKKNRKWNLMLFNANRGCKPQIICYNITIKGNRHRVVDRVRKKKTFPDPPKYREGFYVIDKSNK
ncbi:MAG: hypothetical protein IJA32_04825 [Lachnospiraceae bacterium]|nr:hypothetical protein [Agathobacter sp.]MBQ3513107.1 hypothetical protein [Lachnospiraceae bacterium]